MDGQGTKCRRNIAEKLNRLSRVHERYRRQTTDGWATAYSEREREFTFAICYRPSVCRLSSVTFVHPTQAVQIFGNISTVFWYPSHPLTSTENFTEIVPGEPLRRGS